MLNILTFIVTYLSFMFIIATEIAKTYEFNASYSFKLKLAVLTIVSYNINIVVITLTMYLTIKFII